MKMLRSYDSYNRYAELIHFPIDLWKVTALMYLIERSRYIRHYFSRIPNKRQPTISSFKLLHLQNIKQYAFL